MVALQGPQPSLQQNVAKPSGLRQPMTSPSVIQRRPTSGATKSSGIPVSTGIPVKIPTTARKAISPALTPGTASRGTSPATLRYSAQDTRRSHSAPGKQVNEVSKEISTLCVVFASISLLQINCSEKDLASHLHPFEC